MNAKLIFGICCSLFLIACDPSTKEIKLLRTQLAGTWELDSFTRANNNFYKNESRERLTFVNETDYTLETATDGAVSTLPGKYYILDNPKRGLKTIACIPDVQQSGEETIRTPYLHFDIVSLDSSRLYLVDETAYMQRDSLEPIQFTKYSVYKRVE